jgi:hypothetical protein
MVVCIAPTNQHQPKTCIVCRRPLGIGEACIGAPYPDGRPAFACTGHLLEHAKRSQWIIGWVDFIASRRPTLEARL